MNPLALPPALSPDTILLLLLCLLPFLALSFGLAGGIALRFLGRSKAGEAGGATITRRASGPPGRPSPWPGRWRSRRSSCCT